MDFFTHLLVGIAIGRLLFKDPNKQKVIALGSILPDFDIFLAWIPSLIPQLYLFSHRGVYHSIITLLIGVPIVFVLMNKISGYHRLQTLKEDMTIENTFHAYIIGLLGSYLHLFMDLLNPQGVVLFSPLTEHRYTLSTMNFIEPAVSIPSTLLILAYAFIKYYKKQSFNIKRFDIYSRAISVTFVIFILFNSLLMAQTISTQKTNITTPGFISTQRWVIVDQNNTYSVKLVDQLNQRIITEFIFEKISYNHSILKDEWADLFIQRAKNTIEYKQFLFNEEPNARTIIKISKNIDTNKLEIEFKEVLAQAQIIYYGLPYNSVFDHSIKISVRGD